MMSGRTCVGGYLWGLDTLLNLSIASCEYLLALLMKREFYELDLALACAVTFISLVALHHPYYLPTLCFLSTGDLCRLKSNHFIVTRTS